MKLNYLAPILTWLVSTGCTKYVKPDSLTEPATRNQLEQKIVKAIQESGECDLVKISPYQSNDKNYRVLICSEKKGSRYLPASWSINLDNISEVTVKEKHFPWVIEYLWGDDIILQAKSGEVYVVTMKDAVAKNLAKYLQSYQKQDFPKQNLQQ